MKLPQRFFEEGLKAAEGVTIFGIPLTELSKEELIAAVASLHNKCYGDSILHSTEYQESLNFCMNNSVDVVARNMARDMMKIKELEKKCQR